MPVWARKKKKIKPLVGTLGWYAFKDTEAAVGDLQVPEVDAEVICRQICLVVAVDRDGVDMIGVSVGKHPPGTGFHHEVHGY